MIPEIHIIINKLQLTWGYENFYKKPVPLVHTEKYEKYNYINNYIHFRDWVQNVTPHNGKFLNYVPLGYINRKRDMVTSEMICSPGG